MALFLSPIEKNIVTTLQERDQLIVNDRYGWFSKKTPWLRFTSLAEIEKDSNIRKKWILYGGISYDNIGERYLNGYDKMYNLSKNRFKYTNNTFETGNSILNRPIPGLIDANIQNKGSLGAVREAVISFVCWDSKQLSILEKLFMTPGISCLLEWGWSINIFNNPVNKNLSSVTPLHDGDMTKLIVNNVLNSYGHYDALQGPVVDFNWSLRDDGGFDCSTTITSMAETLLSINIHSKTGNFSPSMIDDEDEEQPITEDIIAKLNNILFTLEAIKSIKINSAGKNVVGAQMINVKSKYERSDNRLAEEKEGRGLIRKTGKLAETATRTLGGDFASFLGLYGETEVGRRHQAYITWEYLENFLNENICFYSNKKSPTPRLHTNRKVRKANKEIEYGWINYRENVVSTDPYVCILPNARMDFYDFSFDVTLGSVKDVKKLDPDILHYTYYDNIDQELRNNFFKPDNPNRVNLNKILLNINFVYHTYLKTQTLHEFLKKLLNGISDVCGNLWDFHLMIDEEEPDVLFVMDNKTIDFEVIEPYQFKVYNENSVVKNVTLNTEVNQEIKTMMMYGTNKKEGSNDIGEQSTYGYLLYGKNSRNLATDKIEPYNEKIPQSDAGDVKQKKLKTTPDKNLYLALKKLSRKRTPETSQRAKTALNKYLIDKPVGKQGNFSDTKFVILPLKLGITIDGIGGIRFGNAIDIDYKPERYNNCYFQVTNVTQTISKDTWDTSLETIIRVDGRKIERL